MESPGADTYDPPKIVVVAVVGAGGLCPQDQLVVRCVLSLGVTPTISKGDKSMQACGGHLLSRVPPVSPPLPCSCQIHPTVAALCRPLGIKSKLLNKMDKACILWSAILGVKTLILRKIHKELFGQLNTRAMLQIDPGLLSEPSPGLNSESFELRAP